MNHDPTTAAEPLDAFLVSCDPIEPSALGVSSVLWTISGPRSRADRLTFRRRRESALPADRVP